MRYRFQIHLYLCLIVWFNGYKRFTDTHSTNTVLTGLFSHLWAPGPRQPLPCPCRPDLLGARWEYESNGVCQWAQIGSLTSCTSSFLASCSPITPSRSPNPKSNTKHCNTSVSPCCVWCCWGYLLRSLKQCLRDGDREGWIERRERKRIGWGVPGWLCCVRTLTPDVTSFRFTSAAKLE